MKNLVKDIEQNCPECECDTKRTIEYLYTHGDIPAISEYYLEIWFFYKKALEMFSGEVKKKMKARKLTLEHFKISEATFKNIRTRSNLREKHG